MYNPATPWYAEWTWLALVAAAAEALSCQVEGILQGGVESAVVEAEFLRIYELVSTGRSPLSNSPRFLLSVVLHMPVI